MQRRSVAMVIILSLITLGIYQIVWFVKTKNEMNSQGASVPTAWLIIIFPYWYWVYGGGVEHVTRGKMSQVITFILLFLVGIIGVAIIQDAFNKAADQGNVPNARAMG